MIYKKIYIKQKLNFFIPLKWIFKLLFLKIEHKFIFISCTLHNILDFEVTLLSQVSEIAE